MISATRRCGGDDDDLHEQGFAKPSKRRGRGDGSAAPRARGCGSFRWRWWWCAAALRGRGGAARVLVEEVVRLGVAPLGVPHPSPPYIGGRLGLG